MENRIDIKNLFKSMQNQMLASLSTQEFIKHPGTKGDATENNWISWMRRFLPKRYAVDKAFVIDSDGNLSDQIDIVIYDKQYSPILLFFYYKLFYHAIFQKSIKRKQIMKKVQKVYRNLLTREKIWCILCSQ